MATKLHEVMTEVGNGDTYSRGLGSVKVRRSDIKKILFDNLFDQNIDLDHHF